ncbi:MAG TPA: hypothetical protein VK874_06075 [Gaiellaceae bacterium]|nr:hypothetical protein [Gaiellaceae bacterium]
MEAALVSLLAPFLPYLVRAGERAAENVADALTTEAGKHARALWEKLFPHVESRPAAAEAAADVASDPDDELARAALQLQLRKLLEHDPELRGEVERMLADAERHGVIATGGGVAVGGDVRADRGSIGVIGTVRGDVSLPRPADDDERP